MRIVFGALSLLIVVAIIGILAKKQLGAGAPAASPAAATTQGVAVPTGTPKQQVDQYRQSVDKAMQQSAPVVNDDTK